MLLVTFQIANCSNEAVVKAIEPEKVVKTDQAKEISDNLNKEKFRFDFTPAVEWLNKLGFVTKEDVLKVMVESLNNQQAKFNTKIKGLRKEIEGTLTLSKDDKAKLAFLLKQVISYR